MRHGSAQNLLVDHALGLLDPATAREVEEHLSRCRDCSREADGFVYGVAALAAVAAVEPGLMQVAWPSSPPEPGAMARLADAVLAALPDTTGTALADAEPTLASEEASDVDESDKSPVDLRNADAPAQAVKRPWPWDDEPAAREQGALEPPDDADDFIRGEEVAAAAEEPLVASVNGHIPAGPAELTTDEIVARLDRVMEVLGDAVTQEPAPVPETAADDAGQQPDAEPLTRYEPAPDDIRPADESPPRGRDLPEVRTLVRPPQRGVGTPGDPFGFLNSADSAIPEPDDDDRDRDRERGRRTSRGRWFGLRRQHGVEAPTLPEVVPLPAAGADAYADREGWAALAPDAASETAPPSAVAVAVEPPGRAARNRFRFLSRPSRETASEREGIPAFEDEEVMPDIWAELAAMLATPALRAPSARPALPEGTAGELPDAQDHAATVSAPEALDLTDTDGAEAPEAEAADSTDGREAGVTALESEHRGGAPEAESRSVEPEGQAEPAATFVAATVLPHAERIADAEAFAAEGDATRITQGDGFVVIEPPSRVPQTGTSETWVPGPDDDGTPRRGWFGRFRRTDQEERNVALEPFRSTVPEAPAYAPGVDEPRPERRGRRRRGEPDDDPRALVSFDEEIRRLARPVPSLAARGFSATYIPGPVEWGLQRYDDPEEDSYESEREYALATGNLVDSSWRFWTILLAVFSVVLFGILVYGYFYLRDLNTTTQQLESVSEAAAVPVTFSVVTRTPDFNTRGSGYYEKATGEAIIRFGGLPPIERTQFYIVWATAGGTTTRVGQGSPLGGSSQFVELRNIPEGTSRIFVTVESQEGDQMPSAPAGTVLLEATIE